MEGEAGGRRGNHTRKAVWIAVAIAPFTPSRSHS